MKPIITNNNASYSNLSIHSSTPMVYEGKSTNTNSVHLKNQPVREEMYFDEPNGNIHSPEPMVYDGEVTKPSGVPLNQENFTKPELTATRAFTYEYKEANDDHMGYALYQPANSSSSMSNSIDTNISAPGKKLKKSNAQQNETLVVFLHGIGEVGANESILKNSGATKAINEWPSNLAVPENTTFVYPHLKGGRWESEDNKNDVINLIKELKEEYNCDNVVLAGHSYGSYGAQVIAAEEPELISSLVVMSGYESGADLSNINVPTRGYNGVWDSAYMDGKFKDEFGDVQNVNASHGDVPYVAFIEDKDSNGQSDLIEWMNNPSPSTDNVKPINENIKEIPTNYYRE